MPSLREERRNMGWWTLKVSHYYFKHPSPLLNHSPCPETVRISTWMACCLVEGHLIVVWLSLGACLGGMSGTESPVKLIQDCVQLSSACSSQQKRERAPSTSLWVVSFYLENVFVPLRWLYLFIAKYASGVWLTERHVKTRIKPAVSGLLTLR